MLLNIKKCLIIAFFSALIISCSAGADSTPIDGWNFEGLKDIHINCMVKGPDKLVFATDTGVFIYKDNHFYGAGLNGKEVVDIVLIDSNEMVAGTRGYLSGLPTLFKTNNGGDSWQPHMGNYGGEKKYTIVSALAIHPKNKKMLFARGWANVSRSIDGGQTWESVFGLWESIGGARFVKIEASYPNIIWAGGANATGRVHLAKSTNEGDSWTHIKSVAGTAGTVGDVLTHLFNPDKILIGLVSPLKDNNIILRSTDGGQTWQTVLKGIGTYTFIRSAKNPRIIYSTGRNATLTLFFAVSKDFGDNWEMIEFEDSPTPIRVNDMVSVMVEDKEVLYLGTNQGIYSYRFGE